MRELEEVALAFDCACRAAGVAYAFVGGLAVIAWGQPRSRAARQPGGSPGLLE